MCQAILESVYNINIYAYTYNINTRIVFCVREQHLLHIPPQKAMNIRKPVERGCKHQYYIIYTFFFLFSVYYSQKIKS